MKSLRRHLRLTQRGLRPCVLPRCAQLLSGEILKVSKGIFLVPTLGVIFGKALGAQGPPSWRGLIKASKLASTGIEPQRNAYSSYHALGNQVAYYGSSKVLFRFFFGMDVKNINSRARNVLSRSITKVVLVPVNYNEKRLSVTTPSLYALHWRQHCYEKKR